MADIELKEDIRLQRKTWAFQRFGWVALAVVILIAVVGGLGGWKNSVQSTSGNIKAETPYFLRQDTSFIVEMNLKAPDTDKIELHFSNEYVKNLVIENIQPKPVNQVADAGGIWLEFAKDSKSPEVLIQFQMKPKTVGILGGMVEMGRQGSEQIHLSHWIYF